MSKHKVYILGEANDWFDSDGTFMNKQNPDRFRKEFKCSIVKTPDDTLNLLVHLEHIPVFYHIQGIKAFMTYHNLDEIEVRGGGRIEFDHVNRRLKVFDQSLDFHAMGKDEIEPMIAKFWPKLLASLDLPSKCFVTSKCYLKTETFGVNSKKYFENFINSGNLKVVELKN